MSALAVAPPQGDRVRGQRGLDEVIVEAWEQLMADHVVACPVCCGEMDPEYGVQARPISGRCRDCGTRLT